MTTTTDARHGQHLDTAAEPEPTREVTGAEGGRLPAVYPKVEATSDVVSLDIKRCYLPIEITDLCPKCGESVTKYLRSDYLSYPKVNAPIAVWMAHCIELPDSDIEHEWELTIILRVTAEPATAQPKGGER